VAGAQRSGTTSLYYYLNSHHAVHMAQPIIPEPKYFLNEGATYDNYLNSVFAGAPENVEYLGEKSTSYYEIPLVAERINRLIPDVKVIIQLRNPVQRALSNYFFSVKNGLEIRSIEEVFLQAKAKPTVPKYLSVDPFDYLGRSDYEKHIRSYQKIFGDRLLITTMERFSNGLESDRLWSFLEIESIPSSIIKTNDAERFEVSVEVLELLTEHFQSKIESLEKLLDVTLFNFDA
jgi:hypothetical protein